jgi:hypothetical protein
MGGGAREMVLNWDFGAEMVVAESIKSQVLHLGVAYLYTTVFVSYFLPRM